MIKTGIIGAELPEAGELLRLLTNHPEVELQTLYAPAYVGRSISAVHFGFIGEPMLTFTDKINPEELDIIFITDDSETGIEILQNSAQWSDLKVVDLSTGRFDNMQAFGMEYGLSEINRKPLVRGSKLAAVPSSSGALALSALFPLASYIYPDTTLGIEVEAPTELASSLDREILIKELETQLRKAHPDLNPKFNIKVIPSERQRSIQVTSRFYSGLTAEEATNIYDSIYDDHNFTFVAMADVDAREVEGTHKNILWITKPSAGELQVSGVADCYLRGNAGDAVHVLNLLFALDEKIGLQLKPVCFGTKEMQRGNQKCWFA